MTELELVTRLRKRIDTLADRNAHLEAKLAQARRLVIRLQHRVYQLEQSRESWRKRATRRGL
jgi:FtsZ-binding cell division protein ZapB